MIQEDDKNKDLPTVPEPTMEEKEKDRPSQEDQIRERIIEEIVQEDPRRLETDNEMNRQEIQISLLTKSGKQRRFY